VLALAASGSRPELTGLFAGLPVAGWSGTLADRFAARKANGTGQGVVRAKTGTLNGVSSLSGVVATESGHLLAFAIMADGVTTNTEAARRTLDGIVARLVACGCR
jgi:serine-type D-Ala-D-Ala carboxypeptidase/endopeptidase (penicillin-binding protein 4)